MRYVHRQLSYLWLFSGLAAGSSNAGGPPQISEIVLPLRDQDIPSSFTATLDDQEDAAVDTTVLQGEDHWRKTLPEGLRNEKGAPLHRMEMDDGVILYLLGSSHVSRDSCDDAKLLMQHVRPDALFVELCSQRVGLLLDPPATPSENEQQQLEQNNKNAEKSMVSRGSLLYTKIQSDYATKLNVTIGGEFRESFQAALSQQQQFWSSQRRSPWGIYDQYLEKQPTSSDEDDLHPRGNRPCAIILGDRPVRITLTRAWESLRVFGKLKLMIALLWSSIKQPSEKELREWMESILNDRSGKNDLITKAMEELGKAFPTLKRVIIEERDEFMVAKLRQTAQILTNSQDRGDEKIIVAVVGAGHCPGMIEKLKQQDKKNKADETAPSPDTRPETVLPGLLETKKRKVSNDEEISSLTTDITQFDYSYIFENELHQTAV